MQAFSRLVGRLAPQHPDRPASQDGDKYGCFSIGIGFCDAERSLSGEKHRRPLLCKRFPTGEPSCAAVSIGLGKIRRREAQLFFNVKPDLQGRRPLGRREARTAFSPRVQVFFQNPGRGKEAVCAANVLAARWERRKWDESLRRGAFRRMRPRRCPGNRVRSVFGAQEKPRWPEAVQKLSLMRFLFSRGVYGCGFRRRQVPANTVLLRPSAKSCRSEKRPYNPF